MKRKTASTIAGLFALAAFAVAVVAGVAVGNPAGSVLLRAMMAMLVCYPVGLAIGHIAQRVVMEQIEAHAAAHPVPVGDRAAINTVEVGGNAEPVDEEMLVV